MNRARLLHPATILGAIVLAAVVAASVHGAGDAGPARIGSAQIKDGSITLADLSPKARRALKGARGPAGRPGPVVAGPAGPVGPAGPPGSVRAYGFVASTGTVLSAQSRNIAVTKLSPGTGAYCLTVTAASGIDPLTTAPVVTPDLPDSAGLYNIAQISNGASGLPDCPRASGWVVFTHNFGAGGFAPADTGFSVLIP
jgi:hypothetical protein